MGAFASYGYCKSPDDKHKLIVDGYAAEVVQGIFSMKIKGHLRSQNGAWYQKAAERGFVFPAYGVRFISINDQFESEQLGESAGGLELAIKRLLQI